MPQPRQDTEIAAAEKIKEIHKLNGKLKGITIFAGSEVDILANGSLDFDDNIQRIKEIIDVKKVFLVNNLIILVCLPIIFN